MITRRRRVMAILAVCLVTCYLGFTVLSVVCRRAELALALGMLGHPHWVTAVAAVTHSSSRPGQTLRLPFSTISSQFRVDSNHGPVRVSFTTYSSSLIALVAVACCGLLIVRAPRARRYGAVTISIAAVVAFSSVRLVGSFWVLRVFGHSAGWLFDDWFGILLVLIDTALGYHLLIWLLLPARRAP